MYQVQKWGNSLGVRIPMALAKKLGLSEGTPIDFEIVMDGLLIRRKQQLEELLEQVTPENLHREVDTGGPEGNEAW
ncbi:MAG: AbrB/MazE/SpoVT family DNA-binding domain-containing protein [Brevibacillus sp.]|nr:AbrB/MazE/SpoVT family DNA-binding domain-containing protein [Brevibacillus sp.]